VRSQLLHGTDPLDALERFEVEQNEIIGNLAEMGWAVAKSIAAYQDADRSNTILGRRQPRRRCHVADVIRAGQADPGRRKADRRLVKKAVG